MNVKQLMTKEPGACHPNQTAMDAAKLMRDHDCGAIPVVGEKDGKVSGMVTDRDICLAALEHDGKLEGLTIAEAMSKDAQTCSASDDVKKALKVMSDAKVRRLPVTDESGKLAGILTLSQIARADGAGISETDLAGALASICEPTSGSRAKV